MLALLLILAPAPTPPMVSEAYLVGNWSYKWGPWVGCVTLRADGTYSGFDQNEHGAVCYAGRWSVEGGELRLSTGGTFCYRIRIGRVPAKGFFMGRQSGRSAYFERQE